MAGVGTRIVGRSEALAGLAAHLERAVGGAPTSVLVEGETGVGKTRLVREFMAGHDVVALAGTCVPVAGEPLPFAALSQALRTGSAIGAVREEVRRSPELARLLPRSSQVPASGDAGRPERGTDDGSRLRLMQAVHALLRRLAAERPVVLVVDDLHWADPSTLDLLSFLATNLSDERVLLLLTYRSDVVGETHPLGPWLAEFGRHPSTARLPLRRLARTAAVELVRELTGGLPEPDRLEQILARSAGNPLFVEQLLLSDRADAPVPTTLHDLLRSRIANQSEATLDVLRAAAVIGRVASVPLLGAALGVDTEEVEAALRPALAERIVELRPDELVGFHHPLFAEVVYADLLPGEQRRLHRAAAEALAAEASGRPEVSGEQARHWHRAGELERALSASVAAAAAYEKMFAFSDALVSYRRALELVNQVPHDLDLVSLRVRGATCAGLVGDTAEAVRLLQAALTDTSDPIPRATLLEQLGSVQFLAGDGAAAEAAYRSALDLLRPEDETPLLARVYAGIAQLCTIWSRHDEAVWPCTEGLRIARAVGARREEGLALNASGLIAASRGDVSTGTADLRRSLAIAREVENPDDLGRAYANLSHVLGQAGDLDQILTLGRDGIVELRRFGQSRQFGSLLLCNVSDALLEAGRRAEAAEMIDGARSLHPRGILAGPVQLLSARVALVAGDLTTAWDHAEQARLVIESESAPAAWLREAVETAAEIELWAGRPEAAYEIVVDGLRAIEPTDEQANATALVALGLRALADDAVIRRDRHARTRRSEHRLTMLTTADRIAERAGVSIQRPERLWAQAELGRLDGARSPDPWSEAATAWTAGGRPLRAAYCLWREAETRLARGVDPAGRAAVRRAAGEAQRLGAERLLSEIEALARWYAIDLVADDAPPEPELDAALAEYSLTAREREVLAELAAGHTNGQIAESMFISSKTVSVHVSNILRKLEVGSRQDAARLGHRLGLRP